jgi:hypothetical protein
MSTDDYLTVFDITDAGFKSWRFPAFGLIFVVIGLLLPMLIKRGIFRKSSPTMERWFPRFFLGFAIFWTSSSFFGTFSDYRRAAAAMRDHRASMVEGVVMDFHPMPVTGHATESFTVNGVKFGYSDYIVTAGFNNTASHGGPIREGLRVRIWHLNGEILRLDIKKRPNQSLLPPPTSGAADL